MDRGLTILGWFFGLCAGLIYADGRTITAIIVGSLGLMIALWGDRV